jgi:glutaredoxin
MSKECPYCQRSKSMLDDCENGGPYVYINSDEASLCVSTEGYDYEIDINYCPMCGRKLSDTDA